MLRPNASLGAALSMFVQGDHSYVLMLSIFAQFVAFNPFFPMILS
jgi:hypothetical protein